MARPGRFKSASTKLAQAMRGACMRIRSWEDQLRALARAVDIPLDRLPRKKSAREKLLLAAAMKRATSMSRTWLAQRLQMGALSSLGPLLHQFNASGVLDRPNFKQALSRFLA